MREEGRINALLERGLTRQQIIERLGVSMSTVDRVRVRRSRAGESDAGDMTMPAKGTYA